jgi:hypothetical protein
MRCDEAGISWRRLERKKLTVFHNTMTGAGGLHGGAFKLRVHIYPDNLRLRAVSRGDLTAS